MSIRVCPLHRSKSVWFLWILHNCIVALSSIIFHHMYEAYIYILTPWPEAKMGIVVACVCPSIHVSVCLSVNFLLIRTINRQRFELESSNLHPTCILEYPRLVLKMEVIDFDLQGHFVHFDSWQIWAVITKYARNMHPGRLWAAIENNGHWFWPSRSFGHFDSEF